MEESIKQNLVIGNTSQLSQYWPKDNTVFISSRNIDYDYLLSKEWNRVYLTFADQRTYLEESAAFYLKTNFNYTIDIVEKIVNRSEKIFVYGTSELWGLKSGYISLEQPCEFDTNSGYIYSKYILTNHIKRSSWNNVFVLHPFNFNSVYRGEKYLFGKIFNSIKNKEKIVIGDTHFYRDMIHPKYVVQQSIDASGSCIIGSGRLVYVNEFIRDLYNLSGLEYEKYVTEKQDKSLKTKRNIYYLKSEKCLYEYKQLLSDTFDDIIKA